MSAAGTNRPRTSGTAEWDMTRRSRTEGRRQERIIAAPRFAPAGRAAIMQGSVALVGWVESSRPTGFREDGGPRRLDPPYKRRPSVPELPEVETVVRDLRPLL